MTNEKAEAERVDAIESADSSDRNVPLHHVNSANEEIVQHLQTTGEEVGMTFRTIMAAVVSIPIYAGQKGVGTDHEIFSPWACATMHICLRF